MAIVISSPMISRPAVASSQSKLTHDDALRMAWWCWLSFLLLPMFLFLYTCWSLMADESVERNVGFERAWFVGNMAFIAIFVPLAIGFRSYLFRNYWKGDCVSPRSYIMGMFSIWITLEIGGIMGLVGCLLSGSITPNLLPAIVSFMLFTTLWPSGRAMVCHGGNTDDPAIYEEPR